MTSKTASTGDSLPNDDLGNVPDAREYARTLLACRKDMAPKHLEMLKAHYNAPDHTVTARQLAAAVGFAKPNAANLQYGRYAGRLCDVLGRKPPFQVAILATFNSGEQPGGEHVKWVLRPQVAAALETLGWVRPRE